MPLPSVGSGTRGQLHKHRDALEAGFNTSHGKTIPNGLVVGRPNLETNRQLEFLGSGI